MPKVLDYIVQQYTKHKQPSREISAINYTITLHHVFKYVRGIASRLSGSVVTCQTPQCGLTGRTRCNLGIKGAGLAGLAPVSRSRPQHRLIPILAVTSETGTVRDSSGGYTQPSGIPHFGHAGSEIRWRMCLRHFLFRCCKRYCDVQKAIYNLN